MRALILSLVVLFGIVADLQAQLPQPSPTLTEGASNTWNLDWEGIPGRTYFMQQSDDLVDWQFFPMIEMGYGYTIPYGFTSSADKCFVRLLYTDDSTSDPYYGDFDGDGISNWDEVNVLGTNPLNPDSDGDGVPDGADTAPNDAAVFPAYWWQRTTRELQYDFDDYEPPNKKGTLVRSALWDAALNSTEQLTAPIPFPNLKARLEELAFPATLPPIEGLAGLVPAEGYSDLLPNPPCYHATLSHHRNWLRRAQATATSFQQRAFVVTERNIDGIDEDTIFEPHTVTIPANALVSGFIDLKRGFVENFTGNEFHYEYFTERLCPLELKQMNMPNLSVTPENSTDLGGERGEKMIGIDGIAYITGEPALAQLRAKFRDMPAAVSVEWRLEIRSERTQRGMLDDRNYPEEGYVTLAGNVEWDIAAAMGGEFVGGICTLRYRLDGANAGSMTFLLRGKNPLDADARAHIDASVGTAFTAYAWGMPRHESRFGPRAYNQFNAGVTNGTPFFGAPDGWGVCQIDRISNREIPNTDPTQYYPVDHAGLTPNQLTSTEEVWNWHVNVTSMNAKLLDKQAVYNRFIGYFRDSYGEQENWTEPPAAHTIGNTTLPAEAWGVMVLYNGADGGVAQSTTPTHPSPPFRSPWRFNPTTGVWTFDDNSQDYAAGRVRPELEDTVATQE